MKNAVTEPKKGNKNSPSSRVITFSCNLKDYKGNVLIDVDKVKHTLRDRLARGQILEYALILHDKDRYDDDDIRDRNAHRLDMYKSVYKTLAEVSNISPDKDSERGYIFNQDIHDKAAENVAQHCPENK